MGETSMRNHSSHSDRGIHEIFKPFTGWMIAQDTFGPSDLEIPGLIIEGEINLTASRCAHVIDSDAKYVSGTVENFDPLTIFALQNEHGCSPSEGCRMLIVFRI